MQKIVVLFQTRKFETKKQRNVLVGGLWITHGLDAQAKPEIWNTTHKNSDKHLENKNIPIER